MSTVDFFLYLTLFAWFSILFILVLSVYGVWDRRRWKRQQRRDEKQL